MYHDLVHLRIGHLPSLFPGRAGQRLLRTHSIPTRRRPEPWLVHAVSAERAASSDAAATPMRRSVCHSLADLSACSCGLPSLHPRQRGLIDDGQSSTTSCASVDACSTSSMSLRDGATTRTANVCRRPKASSCSSSKTGTSCPACTRDPLGSPSCSTRSPQPRPDAGVGTLRMTARANRTSPGWNVYAVTRPSLPRGLPIPQGRGRDAQVPPDGWVIWIELCRALVEGPAVRPAPLELGDQSPVEPRHGPGRRKYRCVCIRYARDSEMSASLTAATELVDRIR